jgi:hypothetical protein
VMPPLLKKRKVRYQRVRETGCLHLHGKRIFLSEDGGSVLSEICVPIYKSKRRHTPDVSDFKSNS